MNPSSGKPKTLGTPGYRKLAMLAGTCLGASAANSNAAAVIETLDFANDLPTAVSNPLPVGTTSVQGALNFQTDLDDVFSFVSLQAGSAFTMELVTGFNYFDFQITDSSGNIIPTTPTTPASNINITTQFAGTVPANGIIVAAVNYNEGFDYTVNLDATTIPETNTAALLGAGAALLASQRRRSSKSGEKP